MEEVENVLRILEESKRFLKEGNAHELINISNQTIHSASISQDPDNIIVAVLVYSLGKILERPKYQEVDGWKDFYEGVSKNLQLSVKHLRKNEVNKCRLHLGRIRNSINGISGDLKDYIREVFRKAEINKAFKIYEHGISSERTAKLLGISLWDLSTYIGQSSISEAKLSISIPIKKRIEIAEDFLG